jgi:NAD(P)H-hydrate epimerase
VVIVNNDVERIGKSILRKVYKKREAWAHKFDHGNLLVIGGSKMYSGSPALNAMAALRSGVDLVTILAPARAADIVASFSPDLITYPLKGEFIGEEHVKTLLKFTKGKTAVVIGGGMWRSKMVLRAINAYLKSVRLPCVIDADAIHAVALNKQIVAGKPFVITPHSYEFYVLSGKIPSRNLEDRIKLVHSVASELKTTVLLKGHVDVISNGARVAINETGNPFMCKGGTGDTLAGICGSLLAQGADCFTAACAAAYINGRAGDIAAKELKQSLLATDLIAAITKAIKG